MFIGVIFLELCNTCSSQNISQRQHAMCSAVCHCYSILTPRMGIYWGGGGDVGASLELR